MILLQYLRKEVRIFLLIILLLSWAISASVFAIQKQDKIILLEMSPFETRVIDESLRPAVEVENFMHHFIGLFYSYTSENFEEHMNRASVYMEIDLLKKYAPSLNKMFDRVLEKPTKQWAFITSIKRIDELFFEIDMSVHRHEEDAEKMNDYKIKIRMDKIKRSLENPFGLRVIRLEEIYE
jgi:hypothetical protein